MTKKKDGFAEQIEQLVNRLDSADRRISNLEKRLADEQQIQMSQQRAARWKNNPHVPHLPPVYSWEEFDRDGRPRSPMAQ